MAEEFKAEGALLDCFELYPHFEDDFELLIQAGYIKILNPSTCAWLKSKTSLAEYFKLAKNDTCYVPGGFWEPIENAFRIKRHSLRKLAGKNANYLKPDESKDFQKLKPFLQQLRKLEDIRFKERWLFSYIKDLFLNSDEKPDTIHKTLLKLNTIFASNVDKKNIKRRLINFP